MGLLYAVAAILFGYSLGSIPFGLVITKLAGLGDIRQIGSGNIGATNVLRTGRKDLAAATLLFDAGKGALAVWIISLLPLSIINPKASSLFREDLVVPAWNIYFSMPELIFAAAGLGAVIGHIYPVWLKFKGGKGVATTLGTLLAISFPVGVMACLAWLACALITRISSLSALAAMVMAAVMAWVFLPHSAALCVVVMVGLVIYRHQDNIKRILAGTEPKIGDKKADDGR